MLGSPFRFAPLSIAYFSIIIVGATISWFILRWIGVDNPVWAIISVALVSDPDSQAATTLVKTRVINTLVGCFMGLLCLLVFGYSLFAMLATVGVTIFLVTSYAHYPANWRLAPVTVIILMDAARQAVTYSEQMYFALLRAGEIALGCCVAIGLGYIYKRLFKSPSTDKQA